MGDIMAVETVGIPRSRIPGLIKLRKLEERALKELVAALEDAPPTIQSASLVEFLIPRVSSIPEADIKEVLDLLISLSRAQIQANVPISKVARDVCVLMEQSDDEELRLVGEQCDVFSNRLTELLNIESLTYPAKAHGVMVDHDNIFLRTRVLTDIRTVFGPDISKLPKGAVILHMLKITHFHSGEERNFYIAMDSEDVESLITTLQRALAKAATLKTVLEKVGIACLTPE